MKSSTKIHLGDILMFSVYVNKDQRKKPYLGQIVEVVDGYDIYPELYKEFALHCIEHNALDAWDEFVCVKPGPGSNVKPGYYWKHWFSPIHLKDQPHSQLVRKKANFRN